MTGNNTITMKKTNKVSTKGCRVTLRFLPHSNGKAIDTVKKILISSAMEYRDISNK